MKIYFYPFGVNYNSYNSRMKDILGGVGDVYSLQDSFKLSNFFLSRKKIIYYLNWFEDYPLIDGRLSLKKVLVFFGVLLWAKMTGRVIYVKHNFISHNVRTKWSILFHRIMEFSADKILVHSMFVAAQKQYCFIPHPLYSIPEINGILDLSDTPYFISFGTIKPYKGLEGLILSWKNDYPLYIVGSGSDEYVEFLNDMIIRSNSEIFVVNRYVSDEELACYVKKSVGVVIANASNTCIVSGAVYFSLSCLKDCYIVDEELYGRVSDLSSVYRFSEINVRHGIVKGVEEYLNDLSFCSDVIIKDLILECISDE
tara:strand:- start:10818 stop:11753 length:936 start_codon:yes stop_codon:yes gene_type:complete